MKRERFKAMVSIAGLAILFGIPVEMYFNHRTPRSVPTHIEEDNYRYLDPHYAGPGSTISGDAPVDGGAYVYDGKKWRKVPVVQGDCTILKSGAMECCGGPGRPPCDNGPGPMQGQWMADAAIHYMNCAEENSEPSNLCCLNEVDEPSPCDIARGTFSSAPPAVLKGPPTQVCVYDFVGSPYLRLNKAVSDPSCADFASPDDNSEELEQDDYNNEITEGSQI